MKLFLVTLSFLFSFFAGFGQKSGMDLNAGWTFRQAGSPKWLTASVPGTVHTDLLANGQIPDPFYGANEAAVQWVEDKAWEYRKSFAVSGATLQQRRLAIVFDGLDTDAEVYLNGALVLRADNMFRQWTVEVGGKLRRSNELRILFPPPSQKAKALKASETIPHPENERIYVRKAQYQFGWDWGPRLVTCGIWKGVRLVAYKENEKPKVQQTASWNVQLHTPKDTIGEAFYFTVNGKPTFIRGTNWIPADAFLPRAKRLQRYDMLIRAAKEANINMLRVWGGGVYEDDAFYDLCDKYGILVWQDFMFAGAMYPGDPAFLQNVEEEIHYQVQRLKHHPSIVLWCGNNEIEEAWHNWGWQKQFGYSAADSARVWTDYKKLFHELIPSILKELDPERPYWPSSPSLGWGRDSAYRKGDVHYWGVWWDKEPVEKYNEKVGRFNSEYGMQGMPDMKTIQQFAAPKDLDTASAVMKVHQKHPFGYENIKLYINNRFRAPKNFEHLVYVSQLMQADAVKTAIEAHRRNTPTTMGTLFWQWNDCWPVVSWSAIDYYGRRKALYYEAKRSFKEAVLLPHYEEGTTLLYLKGVNELKERVDVTGFFYDFIKGKSTTHDEYTSVINTYHDREYFMISNHTTEQKKNGAWCFEVQQKGKLISRNFAFAFPPKELNLPKVLLKHSVAKTHIIVSADKFAYGVFIDVPDDVELEDNFFHLLPGEKRVVKFSSKLSPDQIRKAIRISSLTDTY
jgi:beta-mannosidase